MKLIIQFKTVHHRSLLQPAQFPRKRSWLWHGTTWATICGVINRLVEGVHDLPGTDVKKQHYFQRNNLGFRWGLSFKACLDFCSWILARTYVMEMLVNSASYMLSEARPECDWHRGHAGWCFPWKFPRLGPRRSTWNKKWRYKHNTIMRLSLKGTTLTRFAPGLHTFWSWNLCISKPAEVQLQKSYKSMLSINLAILARLVPRVGVALVIKKVQSSPRADTLNQDIVRVLYQPKNQTPNLVL